MIASNDDVANQIMDVIPVVMRVIRKKFRERRAADLSVAQFRTLGFVDIHNGASLSDVAEHIGLTLPSMSKMVDGLVNRKLVSRDMHSGDRRRICLSLTASGKKELQASYAHTHEYLVEKIAGLSRAEREVVLHGLELMRGLFTVTQESGPGAEKTA
jgi:DNA-binding MarR family transcriptional regulator